MFYITASVLLQSRKSDPSVQRKTQSSLLCAEHSSKDLSQGNVTLDLAWDLNK